MTFQVFRVLKKCGSAGFFRSLCFGSYEFNDKRALIVIECSVVIVLLTPGDDTDAEAGSNTFKQNDKYFVF